MLRGSQAFSQPPAPNTFSLLPLSFIFWGLEVYSDSDYQQPGGSERIPFVPRLNHHLFLKAQTQKQQFLALKPPRFRRACGRASRETAVGSGIIPNIRPRSRSAVGAAHSSDSFITSCLKRGPGDKGMSPAEQDLLLREAWPPA